MLAERERFSHIFLLSIVRLRISNNPSNGGTDKRKKNVFVFFTQLSVSHKIFVCCVLVCILLWSSGEMSVSFSKTGLKQRPHKQHQHHTRSLLVVTHEQNEILHNNFG